MRSYRAACLFQARLFVYILCLAALLLPFAPAAHATQADNAFAHPYGVFLSCDPSQTSRFAAYQTLVIDAAYFSREDIQSLHTAGHIVYTYLNVGSLEDFRPYYGQFYSSTLAPYENWEGERWIDVADPAWQAYLVNTLAADYADKGVDGFFIDNCDVYDLYPTEAMFQGLTAILRPLRATGLAVVVNGGDVYVTRYAEQYGTLADILTGVNQESVFSSIDFDSLTFGQATPEDQAYFTGYIQRVAALGGTVCLLEYTKDAALAESIAAYCAQRGFAYYISDSVELD